MRDVEKTTGLKFIQNEILNNQQRATNVTNGHEFRISYSCIFVTFVAASGFVQSSRNVIDDRYTHQTTPVGQALLSVSPVSIRRGFVAGK